MAENRHPGGRFLTFYLAARCAMVHLMPKRVLIVDDHERFRATARRALEADGWIVVGEAGDGESGLRALESLDAEVIVLDVGLPDISGLEVARVVREHHPAIAVVLISTHDCGDYHKLALATGARGFLAKPSLSGAALDAILGS